MFCSTVYVYCELCQGNVLKQLWQHVSHSEATSVSRAIWVCQWRGRAGWRALQNHDGGDDRAKAVVYTICPQLKASTDTGATLERAAPWSVFMSEIISTASPLAF